MFGEIKVITMKKTLFVLSLTSFLFSSCSEAEVKQEPKTLPREELKTIENSSLYNEILLIEPKILKPSKTSFVSIEDLYSYSITIKKGMGSDIDSINKKGLSLKEPLKKLINNNMAFNRKLWAKELGDALWENDVDVSISGKHNEVVTFTGGLFASNGNIKDFELKLIDKMRELRFKRSQYKWFDGADEMTYYEITSKKDDELF